MNAQTVLSDRRAVCSSVCLQTSKEPKLIKLFLLLRRKPCYQATAKKTNTHHDVDIAQYNGILVGAATPVKIIKLFYHVNRYDSCLPQETNVIECAVFHSQCGQVVQATDHTFWNSRDVILCKITGTTQTRQSTLRIMEYLLTDSSGMAGCKMSFVPTYEDGFCLESLEKKKLNADC